MNTGQTIQCIINEQEISARANPNGVVLDFLRGNRHLTGTREGCREGDCGACTILAGELQGGSVHYRAINSCLMPLAAAAGKHLITIEGINRSSGLNPLQQAFVDAGATQCGFCTPGFLMSFTGFLLDADVADPAAALRSMDGNICRCTGHSPIRRAAATLFEQLAREPSSNASTFRQSLADKDLIPRYLAEIPARLRKLQKTTDGPVAGPDMHRYLVSGGTDLYVQHPFDMVRETVSHIGKRHAGPAIRKYNGELHLSGMTTVEEFSGSPQVQALIPDIQEFMSLFGSLPIRNRATLAGNLVNASPIGDLTSILLALDAGLILREGKKNRRVALREFYLGYKNIDKAPQELVETIVISLPKRKQLVHFEKVSRRRYLDIASVNSTMVVSLQGDRILEARLTAGGVAPVPLLLRKTSACLSGQSATPVVISEALHCIQQEITPISDARGSASYKRLLVRQLFLAHLLRFFPGIRFPEEAMA